MNISMRLDRAALDAKAEALRQEPHFAAAKAEFCEAMSRCWLDTALSRALIADTGAMAIAITIVGGSRLQAQSGAPLNTLIDTLVAGGLASATRIRAMIDMLAAKGAVRIEPHPSDRRRLVIAPTELLFQSFRVWFRCAMGPVARMFALPGGADEVAAIPDLAERYVAALMLRKAIDGFTIFDNWPDVQTFADRRHGYVVMLHLASSTDAVVDVPRGLLAQNYGVSPSHITALLVDAEKQGWLERLPRSSAVRLSGDFADRLDLWVARELAILGMWLELKLAGMTSR